MANSGWTSTTLILLLVVTLPTNIWAYRVLMVPVLGKSHVSSMAAIADGLANRGHKVTLFIGQGFQLNLPEFRNRTEISIFRFKDDTDYDALMKNLTKMAIELGGSIQQLYTVVRKMYVNYILDLLYCKSITLRLIPSYSQKRCLPI